MFLRWVAHKKWSPCRNNWSPCQRLELARKSPGDGYSGMKPFGLFGTGNDGTGTICCTDSHVCRRDFRPIVCTVRLTSTGNKVPGNQEFCIAPNKPMVEQLKNIRSLTLGMV
jgi:hypothetical protein